MEQWKDFFIAEVGASAAVAGLLVVAISINIARIITIPNLPARASQTLIIIGATLVLTSFGLFPGVSPAAFGLAALSLGLMLILNSLRLLGAGLKARGNAPLIWTISPFISLLTVSLPLSAGGFLLLDGNETGLTWIAVAIVLSFVATLQNGWVLMVEILR